MAITHFSEYMDRLQLYRSVLWLSMRAMKTSIGKITPLVIAMMVFSLDIPVGNYGEGEINELVAEEYVIENEGWLDPLYCDGEICPEKDRELDFTPLDAGPPELDFGWWYEFWSDSDSNGFDDRLQLILSGQRESVSKTSIIGDDGRYTVAIIVHYAWHPGESDISALKAVIESHGWDEAGAWFMVAKYLDAIVLDHVPVSSLIDIWNLEGVVLLEEQAVIAPYLDKATKGSKVRASGTYTDSIRGLGFDGSGQVIAVLDTGVDNEHYSLDDFSDENNDNTEEASKIPDNKWVGGCDSTGVGQSGCNDEDPDDGDGHGTHVAGIALGTGDSSRINQGYATGSYLVDVKVMQDYGGGNSQSIIAGLEWVITNRDTAWSAGNDSSRGIQVVSMSFGRASSAVGDSNEDGSSAEAVLVNRATENGLVCVAAIGNDGANNVNSVGSADTAITVGWLDDKNTINRDDDQISSNSNYGPRVSDDDSESWDEMKPWVVAPGSNINSAQHAESSGIIPGSEVNRASDEYTQKSGSSMSTPAVAGLVAIMLEIGEERNMAFMDEDVPGTERYEAIRSILASSSEFRTGWQIDSTFQDNSWNEKYGFGIIDGAAVATEMFGGGFVNETGGPVPPQEGHWVEIESPRKYSWLVEGETYNLRGHINEHGEDNGTIEQIAVKIEMEYRESKNKPIQRMSIMNWSNPIGLTNWTAPFEVPDLPDDYAELEITGMVAARNDIGRWSNTTEFEFPVGRVNLTLEGPSGVSEIEGSVEVYGEFQSIGNATIQWKIDGGEWQDGANYGDGLWGEEDLLGQRHSQSPEDGDGKSDPDFRGHVYCEHMFQRGVWEQNGEVRKCQEGDEGWTSWSFDWDTTQFKDGEYILSVRMVSAVGVISQELYRRVKIDNIEPMPDLLFVSKSISVQEYGIPMQSAYVNTFLEVRATIRNTGDLAAKDVGVTLEEWGERRDEYLIGNIDSGEFVNVVLYWNPSVSGESLISIVMDPLNTIEELDDGNNQLSGIFTVDPRPPGVDLAIREGSISAMTVSSPIPRPDESAVIEVRVDNLGSQDAQSVYGTMEIKVEGRGWELASNSSVPLIMGGSYSTMSFPYIPNQTGPLEIRLKVNHEGSENDWSDNERERTILVDSTTLTGARDANLNPGESPVEIVRLGQDDGDDLLISEKDGTLHMYKLSPSNTLIECNNVIEERWSGDLSVVTTEDGFAHVVWTRRYMGPDWFLMQTVSYSTVDSSCRLSPPQDLMPGIPLSDGKYWGVDIDVLDSEIIVSGYHRDVFTGGTLDDVTDIFLLYAQSPQSSLDWYLNPSIIHDIDADPNHKDPVAVEFGYDQIHILYQTVRNDTTGEKRLGTWYTHGEIDQETWSYRKAVGDYTARPELTVITEDKMDWLISLWREGDPQESEIVSFVTDSSFVTQGGMEVRMPARGLSEIEVVESDRGIQVFFDRVGPFGPQVEYGMIDIEEGWIGFSDTVVRGQMNCADRSDDSSETSIVVFSSGRWQIRTLIDDGGSKRDSDLFDQLRSSLGLDQESFDILLIGVALSILILGIVTLAGVSAQGLRWAGRRSTVNKDDTVVMEDDVIDLLDDSDLKVGPLEVEIIDSADNLEPSNIRKERRSRRAFEQDEAPYEDKVVVSEDIMNGPILPEIPATGSQISCSECGSRIVTSPGVTSTKCPVCGTRVDL